MKDAEITFKRASLASMTSDRLVEVIINSNLSARTKHEVVEWLWANRKFDDEQYRLAQSRIDHLASESDGRKDKKIHG